MTTPMRAIIIPSDTFCSVDGVGFNGVTMVSVAPEIHAVQWYGTNGEIEIQDIITGKMISNIQITSLDAFQAVFDSYWVIRAAAEHEQQVLIDEQTITEV